ncbi:MAG: hypothetical protein ACE5KJ_05765, partial [Candidatus Zixiibacteriota bacterium]
DLSKLSDGELTNFKKRYEKYSNRTFVSAFFGMGALKDFARHRFHDLEARAPKKKKPEPVDSVFLAEKPEYDKINSKFQKIKTKINRSSPGYRLEKAPDELRSFKEEIEALEFSSPRIRTSIKGIIRKINQYLSKIECWEGKKTFYISVEGIPKGYALYVVIGESRYGKIYDSNEWPESLSWEKGQSVDFRLINEDTGNPAGEKKKSIADSEVEFPEMEATLKITKRGLNCKVPSL